MSLLNCVKTIKINDEEVKLYYISSLALALGRTSQTVRKWEIAGHIPKSIFKDKEGRRLYSEEQIATIVHVAEECKIVGGYPISNTNFPVKVHKALSELNKKYLNKK